MLHRRSAVKLYRTSAVEYLLGGTARMMQKQPQSDSLSPEKFQLFVAGLAGLPREEIRKAKSLYLRNAISEFKAMDESLRAFGCVQIFFAVIPIFWPILYAQRRMMTSQRRLAVERIRNALAVWKDDLDGETFDLSCDDHAA
jgi:hypothetical protein